ncbi:putative succinyl-CoA:3-ketoacid-coenzyme A mitochondrial precursor [Paramyrothecium foliicola]|nr:putative succinyl-CoA:3-ketoacid-coenzyme A mitochondrial precursor [Paramyrothecium foliicola]
MFSIRIIAICGLLVLTYAGLNIAKLDQAQLPLMSDRKSITYTFENTDDYEKQNGTVTSIVKEDTGVENWRMNRMLPPTAHPPPLTVGAIDKLKDLDGVIVENVVDDAGEGL